jgi:hypothetical protein
VELQFPALGQLSGPIQAGSGQATPADIARAIVVLVADIANPFAELSVIAGTVVGELRLAVQATASSNDKSTLYAWQNHLWMPVPPDAPPSAPFYIQEFNNAGAWIAVAGYAVAGQLRVNDVVATAQEVVNDDALGIATDASRGNAFTVTIAGNRTLLNPTNMRAGTTYLWQITQDVVGGRTLGYGALFSWPGGVVPVLSVAPGAVDVISGYYDGARIRGTMLKAFA